MFRSETIKLDKRFQDKIYRKRIDGHLRIFSSNLKEHKKCGRLNAVRSQISRDVPQFRVAILADRDERNVVDPSYFNYLTHWVGIFDFVVFVRLVHVPNHYSGVEASGGYSAGVGAPGDAVDSCGVEAPVVFVSQLKAMKKLLSKIYE